MGEIFANRVSEKGLVSGVYEQLLEVNSKKANNTMKKMGKGSEYTFLQSRYPKGQ